MANSHIGLVGLWTIQRYYGADFQRILCLKSYVRIILETRSLESALRGLIMWVRPTRLRGWYTRRYRANVVLHLNMSSNTYLYKYLHCCE